MSPPGDNNTPVRPIRISQDLWDAFGEAVGKLGTNRTAYLREVMRWAIYDPDGKRPVAPKRPAEPTPRKPKADES